MSHLSAEPETLQTFSERLTKIENENRRLRGILALIVVLAGAVLLIGQARPTNKTIEAQEFLIKDTKGDVRAQLSVDKDGEPNLSLYGNEGVTLSSGLVVHDQLRLGFTGHHPLLTMLNGSGMASLGVKKAGNLDPEEPGPFVELMSLPLTKDQTNNTLSLRAASRGLAIGLLDSDGFSATIGKTELEIASTGETRKRSAASLLLFGKDRKVLWSAP